MMKNCNGFTLTETLIGLAILSFIILTFSQVLSNQSKTTSTVSRLSSFEKTIYADALKVRGVTFRTLKMALDNSIKQNYKCDNSNRPSVPLVPELTLYQWNKVDASHEACIDVQSYESESLGNLLDIRFRGLLRKAGTTTILNTKFIVVRRGR